MKVTIVLVLLVSILIGAWPAAVLAAPAAAPLPPECQEIAHHVQYDLSTYMAAGAGMGWVDKKTNSMIYAVQLTECGGAWFFQVFRSGNFKTNFFPSMGEYARLSFRAATAKAWAYIRNYVKGWAAIPMGGVVYYPYHWQQIGTGVCDGCWLNSDDRAVEVMNPQRADQKDWCAEGGYR